MGAKGEKKKTRKKVAPLEKSVPDFDDIHNDILDSYALIYLGYQTTLQTYDDKERKYASVAIDHGVNLLKKGSGRLEEACIRLGIFCRDNNIEQEHLSEGAP